MSHNINSIMYYGEKPWHGIGEEIDHAATSAEAIQAAKLNWEVRTFPMFADVDGRPVPMDSKASIRMDTMTPLGVVGRLYTPIQNTEAFNFFDNVVGEGKAIYHVAGALGKGETVWILAKLPQEIRIKQTDDIINKYLLLTNNHDGLSSLKMFFTPIRVVCQNTLSAANSEINKTKGDIVRIKHFPGIQDKVEAARVILGFVDRTYKELQEAYNKLADYQINDEWLDIYIKTLVPAKNEDDVSFRTIKIRDSISARFESEANTMPGIRGTAWAAYNSVTEYVDHYSLVNPTKRKDDTTARLASIWLGRGSDLKKKAFTVAMQLVDESSAAQQMAEAARGN